jgi:hypothetical protein
VVAVGPAESRAIVGSNPRQCIFAIIIIIIIKTYIFGRTNANFLGKVRYPMRGVVVGVSTSTTTIVGSNPARVYVGVRNLCIAVLLLLTYLK